MNYRIIYSDELYHYGVKGMRWGVRKDKYTKEQIQKRRSDLIAQAPQSDGRRRSASSPPTKGYWKNASDAQISRLMDYEARQNKKHARKGMSKATKIALGVGVAAAVAGVSYAVITKRNNKLAKIAVQRALRQGGHSASQLTVRRGPMHVEMDYKIGSNGLGGKTVAGKVVGTRRAKLTGHSRYRMTKTGQAFANRNKAANNMDWAVRENARRNYSSNDRDWFFERQPELRKFYNHNKREYQRLNGVFRRRWDNGHQALVNTTPINRLRRQQGPKALRIKK